MVSVVFKTVHLFLALFALPQVLAAPGATAFDLQSRSPKVDMLTLHNDLRASLKLRPLTWSGNNEAYASFQAAVCERGTAPGVIELVSGEGTSREAFTEWLSRPEGFNQITSTTVKEVGCSPVNHNCNGNRLVVCVYDSQ